MKYLPCKIPDAMMIDIDDLVNSEKYVSRSDVVRAALRNLIALEKTARKITDEIILEETIVQHVTREIVEEAIEEQKKERDD